MRVTASIVDQCPVFVFVVQASAAACCFLYMRRFLSDGVVRFIYEAPFWRRQIENKARLLPKQLGSWQYVLAWV